MLALVFLEIGRRIEHGSDNKISIAESILGELRKQRIIVFYDSFFVPTHS